MASALTIPPPEYMAAYSGHRLVATCISCMVLIIFFVTARFASRWLHNTPRGWDDYLMIPALIFALLLAALGLVGIDYCGIGHHVQAVTEEKLIKLAKLLIFFPLTYAIAVTFPKLSILAMYLRIFRIPFYRFITYAIFYFIVVSSTILIFMILFQCTPVNYFWDKTIVGGKCHFDVEKLFLYASLPNIITDLIMLLLPLPFIWTLNMNRKMKVGLGITLLTGSSGLATSILRFVTFAEQPLFPDVSWAAVDLALYTILETSMYIIAACLPACRPLFNILRQSANSGFKGGIVAGGNGRPESTHYGDERGGDIELQRGGEGGGWMDGVKGGVGLNSVKGRFKRLGSDAGLGFMHIGNLVRRDQDVEEGGGDGRKGVLRTDSRESMFKRPERAHIRDRDRENENNNGGGRLDGIHIKQEIDIYYDRQPL